MVSIVYGLSTAIPEPLRYWGGILGRNARDKCTMPTMESAPRLRDTV